MSLREDLESILSADFALRGEDYRLFFRDHGQALLDALDRHDALRCESGMLCEAIRGYNFAGVGPMKDPCVESCVLAVESCLRPSKVIDGAIKGEEW